MNRFRTIFTVLASAVTLAFFSCKETKEFDDHADWKKRNSAFIADKVSDHGNDMPATAAKGNIPASFAVNTVIEGVTTALMHMHCGDYWKLYIPSGLAYGTSGSGSIPGHSTLIFEINLTEIAHAGNDLSPR